MKIKYFSYSIIILPMLVLTMTSAHGEGSVILEKDGIIVEQEILPDRVLPIMTGKVIINADVARIKQWLSAVHTYVDWQYNCKEARLITAEDGTLLTHNRISSPWPVSDRDVILQASQTITDKGHIRLAFNNVENFDLKIPSGVVRMTRLNGSYLLMPAADGATDIVYTLDSDPGGKLPAWLVKRAGKELPYQTLKLLREKAESGEPSIPTE
ncbi:MAG: hypothetical protein ACI9VI_000824 [Candidatus Azotimanducaceae bacterium]|jgi:hypothetical protein